ncbi:uncharacterized protein EDB91DRAFT_1251022 [Suillus paluster]|uniref:uncharacterized protein n=1 Tax=Suillus paluster TaxID=48578 RepID=UPI001B875F67|nr:uncharacterized protein EDB91DRAFT_1251022 [Suillus paluster]KAG1734238.1 hypothetical protein EDB91DRAFT_1251022 [Suillus paluster]
MISHQELSAQQVSSYLLDLGDHYTSHQFQNLFWTLFEKYFEEMLPGVRCSTKCNLNLDGDSTDEQPTEVENPEDDHLESPLDESNDEGLTVKFVEQALDVDEVGITTDQKGLLIPKANQVKDYHLRSQELQGMCLWDFVAHVEKRKINKCSQAYLDEEDHVDDLAFDEQELTSEDGLHRGNDILEEIAPTSVSNEHDCEYEDDPIGFIAKLIKNVLHA